MTQQYQYAYGYNLEVDTQLDFTNSTAIQLTIERPDSSMIQRLVPSGEFLQTKPGNIAFPILQGDFSVAGIYKIQVADATPGLYFPTSRASFYVSPSYPPQ